MAVRMWLAVLRIFATISHGRPRADVLGAVLLFPAAFYFSIGLAAVGGGGGNTTTTTSASFSPTFVGAFGDSAVAVSNQILSNPNLSFTGTDVGAAGTLQSTKIGALNIDLYIKAFTTFGPATIPVGAGIMCMSPPTVWPDPNCTGGTDFDVVAGATNVNLNVHFDLRLDPAAASLLTGDLHTTFQTVLQEDGWRFVDGLFTRLRGFGPGDDPGGTALGIGAQLASADADLSRGLQLAETGPDGRMRATGFAVWFKPYGVFGQVDGSSDRIGFSYRTGGFNVGLDYKFMGNWLVGGAFGYGRSWIDQDVTNDTARIDSVQFALYGGYRDRQLHVLAGFMYAHHWVDAARFTAAPALTATSNYRADQFGVGIEAGYKIDTGWGWLQPFGSLVYMRLHTHSFAETGTFLPIAGASESVNALKLSVGVRAWFVYEIAGFTLTPELRARYVHDVLNERRAFTAAFVGDPAQAAFAVRGVKPSPAAAILGAGVSARILPRLKASLNYDAEIHSNLTAHTLQAAIKFSW